MADQCCGNCGCREGTTCEYPDYKVPECWGSFQQFVNWEVEMDDGKDCACWDPREEGRDD